MNALTEIDLRRGTLSSGAPIESGVNLGGVGCGGIEIWPDGTFRHPAFLNNSPWVGVHRSRTYGDKDYAPPEPEFRPEDLYFLLRVKSPSRGVQMRFLMVGHGLNFVAMSNLSRTYKYATIPTIQRIRYTATYPLVELAYDDDRLPIELTLTAWSPFVPHDVDRSSLPGAVFDFAVTSLVDEAVEVSLLQVCTNMAGFHAEDSAHDATISADDTATYIALTGGTDADHPTTGSMTVFAAQRPGQEITAVGSNPYLENLLYTIHFQGRLDGPMEPPHIRREEYSKTPFEPGGPKDRSWLCVSQTVPAGAKAEVRTGLTWYFPNHRDTSGSAVKPLYSAKFADSLAVAHHLVAEADDLKARSRVLPDSLMASTVDPKLAMALLDQLGNLAKSTWLTSDRRLLMWEGLGCCCLNTVDVQHYASFGIIAMFPELQLGFLRDVAEAQRPNGHIPHGFVSVDVLNTPDDEYRRWDVNAQFVLSLYRDWRWTGDKQLLADLYPAANRAYRLLRSLDTTGEGLPDIAGGITYDHWHMRGMVTYMAGIYLATCRAMEAMASAQDDPATACDAHHAFEAGRCAHERFLWGGDHYLLFHRRGVRGKSLPMAGQETEIVSLERNDGLQSDALNGDVYSRMVGLGPILDRERYMATVRLILKRNIHPDVGFLANGTYPDSRYPDEWPFSQWQNPWTGTEYFFAAQCFLDGLEDEALARIANVHDRLSAEGMRFNHVECDAHYARPLSIYAAYNCWLGIDYDVPAGRLSILPNTRAKVLRSPLICPRHLGQIEMVCGEGTTILITEGESVLRELVLPQAPSSITVDGRPFVEPVTLRPGTKIVATY